MDAKDCKPGKCCSCGYEGAEETECPSREDKTHCPHWWDGPGGVESLELVEAAK